MINHQETKVGWGRDLFLVGLISVLMFCGLLWVRPLNNPDEGRYTEIPREMAESGDFVTPRLNGVKYFEKPPLLYWLSAATFKVAGVNEFTARIWTALFGAGGVMMAYAAGRALYGRKAGIWSAVVLGTSALYFALSQVAILDTGVAVMISAALFCFLLGTRERKGRRRRLLFLGFYVAMALAVLLKGLIGVVLPAAVIGVWVVLTGQWRNLRPFYPWMGLVVFFGIAAPWHVMAAMANRSVVKEHDFAWFYFVHEHFLRFTTSVHGRTKPWWYFGPVLIGGMVPWVVFGYQAFAKALAGGWRCRRENAAGWFLVIWAAVIFLFFSKSQSKLVPYMLPIIPALAVLIGRYVADALEKVEMPAGFRRSVWVWVGIEALLVIALALAPVLAGGRATERIDPERMDIWHWSLLLVFAYSAAMTAWPLWKKKSQTVAVTMAVGFGTFLLLFNPVAGSLDVRSTKVLAKAMLSELKAGDEVFCVGYYPQDLPAYLGRVIGVADFRGEMEFGIEAEPEKAKGRFVDREEFLKIWGGEKRVFVVVEKNKFKKWFPKGTEVLAEAPRYLLVCNRVVESLEK